ncbi:MAG: nucleoside deaminase [Candidatus Cyclobacteriaceae bacterium M3_2C_046]
MKKGISPYQDDPKANGQDREFIKKAYELAQESIRNGNPPFGAILVHQGKIIASGQNEVKTSGNVTLHAETVLLGEVANTYSKNMLAESILYTSTEPCLMCCGAIYWAGINTIVFGTTESQMIRLVDGESNQLIPSRKIFGQINPKVRIIGPVMEKEGLAIHADYLSGS